jgi:hypothetical protein
MSRRYGRNQKRRHLERIAELEHGLRELASHHNALRAHGSAAIAVLEQENARLRSRLPRLEATTTEFGNTLSYTAHVPRETLQACTSVEQARRVVRGTLEQIIVELEEAAAREVGHG